MNNKQQSFAVMFADVVGSTGLYERLGDEIASHKIGDAIKLASDVIQKHEGIIVKHIGDEVMCRFDSADNAVQCACEINELMASQPIQHGVGLVFSIGINWGLVILQDDGDIFGDVVNLAARMAKEAKAAQIIATEYIKQNLTYPALLFQCREIDRIQIKGKPEEIPII